MHIRWEVTSTIWFLKQHGKTAETPARMAMVPKKRAEDSEVGDCEVTHLQIGAFSWS